MMNTIAQPYRPVPYVLDRETAPAYWLVGTLWFLTATGQQTGNIFSMLEQQMPQGPGPTSHAHPYDEGFYIIEGQITFHCGGGEIPLGPGGLLHIPRYCEHTFTIEKGPARVLNYYTPAGSELIVMSIGQLAPTRTMPSFDAVPPPPVEQADILGSLFGQINIGGRSFVDMPKPENMKTQPVAWNPVPPLAAQVKEKLKFTLFDQHWKVLAQSAETGGAYSLCHVETSADFRQRSHHSAQDEAIYLLGGSAKLTMDGKAYGLKEGAFAFIPAGTVHHFQAEKGTHRLHFFIPGGFEQIFMQFGSSAAETPGDSEGLRQFLEQSGTVFL